MAKSTGDVLNHHLSSFGAGRLDDLMQDYNEESVVVVPNATHEGVAKIHEFFNGLFTEFTKPGVSFEMTCEPIVHRDIAFIAWKAETPDNSYEFATDTLHVVDGKIRTQTFAGKITPKG